MTRIITYNVNGIRAAISKGWIEWLKASNADVVCLQEIKANHEQVDIKLIEDAGYHHYFYPAIKKGYSGVAIITKKKPDNIVYGMNIKKYDEEGRFLRVDFGTISIISVYMPSGSSGDERQTFKMQWLPEFTNYINELKKERPKLIICGDYNICNKPIDIHNPKSNKNSSGFLPEEREWFDTFLETGFVDSFRHYNKEPHQYTWWSFRFNARAKNLGWRIDYNLVTQNLTDKIISSHLLPDEKHSDHCACVLDIDI